MAGRNSVSPGQTVVLTAIFLDAAGIARDPDDLYLRIYATGMDPRTGHGEDDAWVWNASLTSGGTGPEASETLVTRQSVGHYSYTFIVPEDADIGPAYDEWFGEVDGQELEAVLTFVIVGAGSIGTTYLYENNILFLQLLDTIAATDGSTLGTEVTYYFTTTYNPMYSSIRRIRLDMGQFLSDVPDDTINLAIFEASLLANVNTYITSPTNVNMFTIARREYTTCMAELTLARALLGDAGVSERMSKTLGDLSVSRGGNIAGLKDALAKFEDCAVRWEITLQSGGEVGPGMSVPPGHSVKGAWAEDAIYVRRQWEPTSGIGVNSMSAANSSRYASGRRNLKTFRTRH